MEASKYFQVKENYIARGGDIKRGRKGTGRRGDGEEMERRDKEGTKRGYKLKFLSLRYS